MSRCDKQLMVAGDLEPASAGAGVGPAWPIGVSMGRTGRWPNNSDAILIVNFRSP